MLNLLTEPVIRVTTESGPIRMTLPEIYAASVEDRICGFPSLRPHQAPAFHAFLVQIATLGCLAFDDETQPGADPEAWGRVLRSLTPKYPDDEPWSLVVAPDQPGLLQAPVPGGDVSMFKDEIDAPDAIDILVTAKNHDFKAGRMVAAQPEDWFFALLSLQTQEGFLGAGNYGIARMNGGFASRPYLRVAPSIAGFGGQVMRDIRALLEDRESLEDEALSRGLMRSNSPIGLVWLQEWDGVQSITLDQVHPLFVEICRRVRLFDRDGRIVARKAGSKAARIDAKAVNGVLGDPWAPVEKADQPKLFTISDEGFSYRKLTQLLFSTANSKPHYDRPRLSRTRKSEKREPLTLYAAALARGQGKTEGFHARAIPISDLAASYFQTDENGTLARRAAERVARAGEMWGKVLRPALIVLVQEGPAEPSWTKPSNGALTDPMHTEFDQAVDSIFFDHLWDGLKRDDDAAATEWNHTLADLARKLLQQAADAPRGEERRIIALARATNLLDAQIYKLFPDLRTNREAEENVA
jgi:CRISPR system Cascade subunit CasA